MPNGLSRISGLRGLKKSTIFQRFGKHHRKLVVILWLLRRRGHILSQTGRHLAHQIHLMPPKRPKFTEFTCVNYLSQNAVKYFHSGVYPWSPTQRIATVIVFCYLQNVPVPGKKKGYRQYLGDFSGILFQHHFTRCWHMLTPCVEHFYHKFCAKRRGTSNIVLCLLQF